MASTENEIPADEKGIEDLFKSIPANQILFSPPSYDAMNPDAEGSWRFIHGDSGEQRIGIIWTDWENGAGVVTTKESESTSKLLRYFVVNKMMSAPAGIAFSSAEAVEGVSLSEAYRGLLSEGLDAVSGLVEGDTEDDTE